MLPAELVNILLVDDRPDGLLTLEAVLRNPTYNLVMANSGKEALEQIRRYDFAVILLDVQMPDMDGFQTAARIKEFRHARDTPILFVTAIHKDPFYIYKGYHVGAVDYIFKPFDPAILQSKVAVFVHLFQQQMLIKRQLNELHQKDQALYQSQKLEAIGRLAGGVAHDFNNLITGILGLAHELTTTLGSKDPRQDDLQEMIKASNRALALTKQLLAFGRRQISSPRMLDINSIVTDMAKMLQRLITEDIQLRTILCTNLKPVKADPGQIEQILMNLVLNARDAMPKGGDIRIVTDNVNVAAGSTNGNQNVGPGSYVLMEIIDSGCGIEPSIMDHIFEPYYTTKEKEKGTGLGLSTVYGLVMQCDGYVNVESTPGKGTIFKIYLPQAEGQVVETPTDEPSDPRPGKGETILVVEDEEIVRQVATRILRKNNYTVFEAQNALDALDLIESYKEPIHLLVTDVVMPGMNGRQLAETLLLKRPDLAVLYMSGYSEDVVLHRGMLDPGIAFIEKSFTAPVFLKKVRDILDQHAAKTRPSLPSAKAS